MNYTYKWQLQPQIAWKGPSTNSVVPSWSRPFNNGANPGENPNPHFASNAGYQSSPLPESGKEKKFGFWGKPRPLKQWRKQLAPRLNNYDKGQQTGIGIPMDKPGGAVYLGEKSIGCVINDCSNSFIIKENIIKDPALKIVKPSPDDSFYDVEGNKEVCVACNPENLIIKPYVQVLKNNYTESGAYLYSRVKNYKQRAGNGIKKIKDGTYFNKEGQFLYPSNNTLGPPEYYYPESQILADTCDSSANDIYTIQDTESGSIDSYKSKIGVNNPVPFIYKPSNQLFPVEGAVSSGNRLSKLKYNTINKNYANSVTAYGLSNRNNGNLDYTSGNGFFMKIKAPVCKPYRPPGNHTVCWVTPTGNVVGRVGRNKP